MLPTAKEFRHLRKKAGLTQKELAERAGLSQSLIARIEKGDIDTKLGTARRILDVIRESEGSKESRSLEIKDYMVSPVIYCKAFDPIKRVVALMEENAISQMPVMEGGKPVGSITDTHLVRILAKKGARSSRRKISSVMSKPLPELDISAPMDRAVHLLTKSPAVLIRNGPHIAGILTKADVLQLMI